MDNVLKISSELKNSLLNINKFNKLSRNPNKLIEKILRQTYKLLINPNLSEDELKNEIKKIIITIFINNRVFIHIRKNQYISMRDIDNIINIIINKLILIREKYTTTQIKNIFELIICQFYFKELKI
ncbi:MAG: hypothetical protein ACTSQO_03520 [Candidatus Helarchaeota archaeon]